MAGVVQLVGSELQTVSACYQLNQFLCSVIDIILNLLFKIHIVFNPTC